MVENYITSSKRITTVLYPYSRLLLLLGAIRCMGVFNCDSLYGRLGLLVSFQSKSRRDEAPLLRGHGRHTQSGLPQSLEFFKGSSRLGVGLELVQRNHFLELAPELDMDNLPFRLLSGRLGVMVRVSGIEGSFYGW